MSFLSGIVKTSGGTAFVRSRRQGGGFRHVPMCPPPCWRQQGLTLEKALNAIGHAVDLRIGQLRVNRQAETFARGFFGNRE